ncbi:MAG: zinc ribbon domain-containing protein [Anaerolineales bacterium]|nr:zinc ribbon domain-containing protein [Anaerolineales bacterium]
MADLRCPNCGHLNAPDTVACDECGFRLSPEAVPPGEVPGWLASIRRETEGEAPQAPPPQPSTDWLSQLRGADASWQKGPPAGDPPSWVQEAGLTDGTSADARETPGSQPAGSEADGVPDWLARIRELQAEQASGSDLPLGVPDLPESSASHLQEPESRPLPPLQLPDLEDTDSGVFYPPGSPRAGRPTLGLREAGPPSSGVSPADSGQARGASGEGQTPNWLGQLEAEATGSSPSGRGMPHVPALMRAEDLSGPQLPGDDFSAEALSLPEWLGQLGSEAAAEAAVEGKPDLAPATLPAWLEAMRPVDAFRSSVEIGPEEEQVVEAAGPLAGLRGVLLAEPVVAIPRTASAAPAMLEVTERQYAQAELMHRLVEEEQREVSPAGPRRRRVPIVRWLVAGVLLAAAALPTVLGIPTFPLPATVPLELDPLVNLIAAAPVNRPSLVVFDYEPGNAAEMQAVAEPMFDQMMQQGMAITALSTRAAGAMMADQMLTTIGVNYGYSSGQGYVNLGYLPGGSTGIQLWCQNPLAVPVSGYALPTAPDGTQLKSPWQVPMLAGVDELADFGMVTVISANAESARSWIEQATPWLGATPLVVVITTGADPVIRPYYEAPNPQVDGMLSGLPAALSYSMRVGRPGAAFGLWNAFGLTSWAAAVLMVLGSVPAFVAWVETLRKARAPQR